MQTRTDITSKTRLAGDRGWGHAVSQSYLLSYLLLAGRQLRVRNAGTHLS
ncbi:MAG: hypothetical protein UHI81_12030 [Olegusella sp.]|nr:hypothetical protein [Olegusella sp.]